MTELNLDYTKQEIQRVRRQFHPLDAVEALREVERYAGEQATEQEKANDRDGVPERKP